VLDKGKEILRQEGRLGYEQYSATGFYLWGIKLPKSLSYSFIKPVKIFNIEMYYDARNLAYLTSEPFFLAKMEIGKIDNFFDEITTKIYQLQKIRWEKYNIITAISEDSTDKMPWFVYNSVYFNSQTWLCTSPGGKPYPQYKSLSTKSAFAWSAIYSDSYSTLLKNKVKKLVNQEYGYYTGIYEKNNKTNKSVNINTNAVILESLLYKKLKGKSFLEN
ncbi:MAG: DUF3131 domain-containing protein, partial [Candidatus Sericytochromatia bacterium]|nr:DUF3131 domain-containing protein [Candidatus Sericytochromatia bacterium]